MPKKSTRKPAAPARRKAPAKKRSAERPEARKAAGAKAAAPKKVEVHTFPKRKLEAVPAPREVSRKAEPLPSGKKPAALPSGEAKGGRAFPIEIDPKRVEETIGKIREEVSHWAKKGRYTKVRFKWRGKQLLPDLPLVAVMAAEGASFYWGGILRALIFNIAGRAVFDVELVNDSEKRVQAGREALLSGDADKALSLFNEARDMDRDNPNVHLNLGIVLKLKGDFAASRAALEKAKALDPLGPFGGEAEKILATFPKPGSQQVVSFNGG